MSDRTVRTISREEMLNYQAVLHNHRQPWHVVRRNTYVVIDADGWEVASCNSESEASSFATEVPQLEWRSELITACEALRIDDEITSSIASMYYDDALKLLILWLRDNGHNEPAWALREAGVRHAFDRR